MTQSKAHRQASGSTLPVMSPFSSSTVVLSQEMLGSYVLSQKACCPGTRYYHTHTEGSDDQKEVNVPWAPKHWPEGCCLYPLDTEKITYLIPSFLRGGQPTGHKLALRSSRRNSTPAQGLSFLSAGSHSSLSLLEAVLEVERKMWTLPTCPHIRSFWCLFMQCEGLIILRTLWTLAGPGYQLSENPLYQNPGQQPKLTAEQRAYRLQALIFHFLDSSWEASRGYRNQQELDLTPTQILGSRDKKSTLILMQFCGSY